MSIQPTLSSVKEKLVAAFAKTDSELSGYAQYLVQEMTWISRLFHVTLQGRGER
jgi:hypothetical protein